MSDIYADDKKELLDTAKNGGGEVPYGSNRFLYIDGEPAKDGTFSCYFNSHNLEQFYFQDIKDFISFFYDNENGYNKSAPHGYSYFMGDRDMETGIVTLTNGSTIAEEHIKDRIDSGEDGGMVWSKIQYNYETGTGNIPVVFD